ncbi:MAPEG family protein [Psychromarinibacter sp. S121]|uniref:MAPEG family protein n=1 Tax=Psychromarinibacter sp. S121 TaxID=3415127 RepID=UPI003C7D264B
MTTQRKILIGMALGVVWSIALIWIGIAKVNIPPFSRILVEPFYLIGPGIALMFVVAAIAMRRFLTPGMIDGGAPAPGSAGDIDLRVLRNTVEQSVLAACLWPAIAYLFLDDGLGVVMSLTVGFVVARLAFWIGYHVSPPLRAFGFAATMYPTVLALVWALILRAT